MAEISHNPPCFALIFHIIPMLDVLGMGIWNHRMGVRAAGGLCVIPARVSVGLSVGLSVGSGDANTIKSVRNGVVSVGPPTC